MRTMRPASQMRSPRARGRRRRFAPPRTIYAAAHHFRACTHRHDARQPLPARRHGHSLWHASCSYPCNGSTAIPLNIVGLVQRRTGTDNGVRPTWFLHRAARTPFCFLTGYIMATKATSIKLFSFSTPPMRAFHLTWMAFFVCFFAWFACAPLMPVIKGEFGLSHRADRQHQHRRRRHHHPGAADRRPDVRPLRPAQDLHRPAAARRHPGAGRGAVAELRKLPVLPPRHRRGRRQLRHHPVPHLGDVRAQRGRHRQRRRRRLGQHRRRRRPGADAAADGRRHHARRQRRRSAGASPCWCRAC